MKLPGSSRFLGLAVSDRGILAAQIHVSREQRDVGPMAEFVFPESLSWEKPEAVGKALRQFLRQHHFSAARAVVGLPARWLMAREKEVPPASAQLAASTLRLQAERDFPSDLDLVFEYAGQCDPAKPSRVLLAAVMRQHLSRIIAMAEEAGLSLRAVTSSTLALVGAAGGANDSLLSVVVGPDSAEMMLRSATAPRMLKHLPISTSPQEQSNGHPPASLLAIGSEMQRAVALMPQDGADGTAHSVFLWDGVGLTEDAAGALGQRSGLEVRVRGDLADLGVRPARTGGTASPRLGVAVALALTAARPERAEIDFLHTRLAAPKKRRVSRQTLLAVATAILIVGGIGWLWWDTNAQQKAYDADVAELDAQKPALKEAQAVADKVTYARGWYDSRPPYLGCLREVSAAFPMDNPIYATTFNFYQTGKGTINGKSPDQNTFLEIQKKLLANQNFTTSRAEMRDAGGRSRDVTFSLSFTYHGTE